MTRQALLLLVVASAVFAVPAESSRSLVVAEPRCSTGDPAWSPDGRSIAFAGNSSPNLPWQIQLANVNGGDVRVLTTKPADDPPYVTWTHDFQPAWAPDGRRLAFVSGFEFWNPGYSHALDGWSISVLDTTTGALSTVGSGRDPTWSRRGGLAYALFEGPYNDPAGISVGTARLQGSIGDPTWSPDGRRLAYDGQARQSSDRTYVGVMNRDGTHRRRLAVGYLPQWSPDGRWIAYWTSSSRLALVSPDDRRHRRLVGVSANGDAAIVWSPNGRSLAVGQP